MADHKTQIDSIFSKPTLEEMYAALEKDGSEWATKTLSTLRKMVNRIIAVCIFVSFISLVPLPKFLTQRLLGILNPG